MTKRRSKQFTGESVRFGNETACLRQLRVKIPLTQRENGEAEDIKVLALWGPESPKARYK
jgi:hypothetical protein